jgi:signal transduction histidine kinase
MNKPASAGNRRRRYWINPGFQGRYLATILLLELLVALVTAGLTLGFAFVLISPMTVGPAWHTTVAILVVMLLALAGALVWIGVRVSNRICGPVYNMLNKLAAIRRGEQPGPIRLREKDELKELAQSINETVEYLKVGSEKKESV